MTPTDKKNANWVPSLTGRVDPVVEQAIRHLYNNVYKLRDHVSKVTAPDAMADALKLPKPSLANPKPVASPPDLNGHPGLLAEPQKGMATVVQAPPSSTDILSRAGSIITYNGSIYVYDASTNPGKFRLLGALGAPI